MRAECDYQRALRGHAGFYAGLIARDGTRLHGAGIPDDGRAQLDALRVLQLELENLYVALQTAMAERNWQWIEQIAAYLFRFLIIKGEAASVADHYRLLLETTQQGPDSDGARAEMYGRFGLAAALVRLGKLKEAKSMALAIGDLAQDMCDREGEALSLRNLGLVEYGQGNFIAALELHTKSLEASRSASDTYGESASLSNLGLVNYGLGNLTEARALQEQAMSTWRKRGDLYGEASSLQSLGNMEALQGNYESARELFDQVLRLSHRLGNRSGQTGALVALGFVARKQGRYEESRSQLLEALSLAQELGDRQLEITALGNLATVEYELEEFDEACECFGKALLLAREVGNEVMMAYLSIRAAAALAAVNKPSGAVAVLQGAVFHLGAKGHEFDQDDLEVLDSAKAMISKAIASSGMLPETVATLEANGEAMDLQQLMDFALAALTSD